MYFEKEKKRHWQGSLYRSRGLMDYRLPENRYRINNKFRVLNI